MKVTKPSFQVRPGDVISLRERDSIQNLYRGITSEHAPEPPEWLTFDSGTLSTTVAGLPGPEDISLPVDANTVVEFLSR